MVAIKAQQAERFLKNPATGFSVFLLYGPDEGMIAERGAALAKQLAGKGSDAGEIIRIDETDLTNDPGRLSVELRMTSMFGDRKIVRLRGLQRTQADEIEDYLSPKGIDGILIIEAGNLKPTVKMRQVCEKAANAAAIACYPDEDSNLAVLIDQTVASAKLKIAPDVRDQLVSLLGADRALTRSELDKLILYVSGRQQITFEDIDAIIGDASEAAIDKIVNASSLGDAATALYEADRAASSGQSYQAILILLQRHLLRLHQVRGAMDAGKSLENCIRSMRPPLHFKQQPIFSALCRKWTTAKLDRALTLAAKAIAAARFKPMLEREIAERALIEIARLLPSPNQRSN